MDKEHIIYIPELTSTIEWMKKQAREYDLPHGFCVLTDYQTAGRGQGTNKWESAKAENLLFSMFIRPNKLTLDRQFSLTKIITIAIQKILQPLVEESVSVKWPNDIYAGDRKICGMLIENTILGNSWEGAIAGIGINVNQSEFLSDASNPVSLKQLTGNTFDRKALLYSIIDEILCIYDSFGSENDLHNMYMSRLYRRDGFYCYETADGERFSALISDIGDMGHLTLEQRDGKKRTFAFKEVKYILD